MAAYLGWSLGPPLPARLQQIIDEELCALDPREIRSDVPPQATVERPESPESPPREQARRIVRDENGQGLAGEGATSPRAPSPLVRPDLEYTAEKTADLDSDARQALCDRKGAEGQDAGLEAELDQTRHGLHVAEEKTTDLETCIKLARRDLMVAVGRVASLEALLDQTRHDLASTSERADSLDAEVQQARQHLAAATEQRIRLAAGSQMAQMALATANKRIESLKGTLRRAQQDADAANKDAAGLEDAIREAHEAEEAAAGAIDKMMEEAAHREGGGGVRPEPAQATLDRLTGVSEELQGEGARIEASLEKFHGQLMAARGVLNLLREHVNSAEEELRHRPGLKDEVRGGLFLLRDHRLTVMRRVERLLEELGEDRQQQQRSELDSVNAQNRSLDTEVTRQLEEIRGLGLRIGELQPLEGEVSALRAELEELGEDRQQQQRSELDSVNAQNRSLDTEVTRQLEEIRGLGLRIGELQPLEGEVSALRAELEELRAGGGQSAELSALRVEVDRLRGCEAEASSLRDEVEGLRAHEGRLEELTAIRVEVEGLGTDGGRSEEVSALRIEVERLRGCEADASALRTEVERLRADEGAAGELSALRAEADKLRVQCRSGREWMMQLDEDKKVLFRKWQDARGNFRVVCRARPVEAAEGLADVSFELPNTLVFRGEKFAVDGYFGPRAGHDALFNEVWELAECAVGGEDVCVFTYGQTGSGKTMTLNTILDRLAGALFDGLAERQKVGWRFGVRAQLLEVYGGSLYDIAAGRKQVKFRSTSRLPTVPGCDELVFESAAEMRLALAEGCKRRTTAATLANKQSSRSHTITLVHLSGTNSWTDASFHATMAFVDLAGTETLEQAGADRKNESQQVSKDLCAIRSVMHALALGVDAATWRDSLVTQVLRNYMVRRTMVILAISPLEADSRPSRSTLEFGNKLLEEGPKSWPAKEEEEWRTFQSRKTQHGRQDKSFHQKAQPNPSTASPSPSLQGKVVIITGGSKGIGKATSIALARLGAKVVINYSSDEEAAQGVLAEIQKLGAGEARLVRADASTLDGVQSLVKQTVDAYAKIDVLIPNAGVLPMKDLEHTTEADFDRTFAINVKGPYFLAQAAAPYMARGSHIIFVSTTLTTASTVMPGYLLYNSTKGAVEQMTRVISKDLGRKGVLVNAVAPGPTGTELFYRGKSEELLKTIANFSPQGRIATPEEIAEAVVFLAQSTWVSGQVLRANGGMA